MGFASGSVSFRRFAVVGQHPATIEQDLLDRLAAHALREREMGTPDEEEYGWSGGRHIFDSHFSFEHNVFNDAICFGLRIDSNKVPGDLKKAYQIMEEEAVAATNPSGFISKQQKRDVKQTIQRKIDEELRSGKFRRSKLMPILWDIPGQVLYCSASGTSLEKLLEIFERTFDLKLLPLTAGSMALRLLEPRGRRRDYEDSRPTRFVLGPDGESVYPEYPWVAKGPEPKDFLGNEFLTWLWHEADAKNAVVQVSEAGSRAGGRTYDVTLFIDRSLDLDCAYGQTGKDTIRGEGPSRTPEARDALRVGKLPRKAGLIVEANRQQFTLTLNPEMLSLASAVLPEVEDAESPRVLFEERITLLRDLCKTMDGLFDAFLKVRCSSAWEGQVSSIRKWINQTSKAMAAVA
ncbi:MAG TPA: hypothetical protein VIL86_02235 [Tepidisphaeraceae bacterium]|jgi:hypothetical protein